MKTFARVNLYQAAVDASRSFRRDRRGVSALEFALIAPLVILMFFGMTELSTAVTVQRRVSHSNAAIGDLVAQYANPTYNSSGVAQSSPPAITPALMYNIFTAANLIIAPFPTTPFQIRITSLVVDKNGVTRVNWSCVSSSQTAIAPLTAVATYTAPSGLISTTMGDSLIMSQTYYLYTTPVQYYTMTGVNFNNTFYFKPRASPNVGFYAGTSSPAWSLNWDSASTAQALNTAGANCSYQTG